MAYCIFTKHGDPFDLGEVRITYSTLTNIYLTKIQVGAEPRIVLANKVSMWTRQGNPQIQGGCQTAQAYFGVKKHLVFAQIPITAASRPISGPTAPSLIHLRYVNNRANTTTILHVYYPWEDAIYRHTTVLQDERSIQRVLQLPKEHSQALPIAIYVEHLDQFNQRLLTNIPKVHLQHTYVIGGWHSYRDEARDRLLFAKDANDPTNTIMNAYYYNHKEIPSTIITGNANHDDGTKTLYKCATSPNKTTIINQRSTFTGKEYTLTPITLTEPALMVWKRDRHNQYTTLKQEDLYIAPTLHRIMNATRHDTENQIIKFPRSIVGIEERRSLYMREDDTTRDRVIECSMDDELHQLITSLASYITPPETKVSYFLIWKDTPKMFLPAASTKKIEDCRNQENRRYWEITGTQVFHEDGDAKFTSIYSSTPVPYVRRLIIHLFHRGIALTKIKEAMSHLTHQQEQRIYLKLNDKAYLLIIDRDHQLELHSFNTCEEAMGILKNTIIRGTEYCQEAKDNQMLLNIQQKRIGRRLGIDFRYVKFGVSYTKYLPEYQTKTFHYIDLQKRAVKRKSKQADRLPF